MNFETIIQHLHAFHSCSGLLLVGAGNGSLVPLISSLYVKEVILVEADAEQIKRMQKTYTLPQEWKVVNALVYKDAEECEYYYTTHTSANGIVPVETLKCLWKNITLKSFEIRQSISVNTLLKQVEIPNLNWFIVDCYTDKTFFEENQTTLEMFDVIIVRLLDNAKEDFNVWMDEQGFRFVVSYQEINPQVLLCVYLKNWKRELVDSKKSIYESTIAVKELEELKNQKHTTTKERDDLKAKLVQTLQESQANAEQTQKALQEQEMAIQTLNAELVHTKNTLSQTKTELEQKVATLQETLKSSETKNAELAKERDELKTKLDSLQKENEAKTKQFTVSQQQVQEQQYRSQRLEQEIVKLEAQLELIKDVILREKAF